MRASSSFNTSVIMSRQSPGKFVLRMPHVRSTATPALTPSSLHWTIPTSSVARPSSRRCCQHLNRPSPTRGHWLPTPEQLKKITEPVLILRGEKTFLSTFVGDSAKHIAEHVRDFRIHELPGLGHFAPLIKPEPIAEELISFFGSVLSPA